MALTQDQFDKVKQTIAGYKEQCEIDESAFNNFEISFMDSMADRVELYGDSTFISDKQWKVIHEVYDKVSG